jgi:hypothetical protein
MCIFYWHPRVDIVNPCSLFISDSLYKININVLNRGLIVCKKII